MNKSATFKDLEKLIQKEKSFKVKQEITLKQIDILKEVQKEFLIRAQELGYSLESYNVLTIMREQYEGMKFLAEKVNLPIIGYDNKIEEINRKLFG